MTPPLPTTLWKILVRLLAPVILIPGYLLAGPVLFGVFVLYGGKRADACGRALLDFVGWVLE